MEYTDVLSDLLSQPDDNLTKKYKPREILTRKENYYRKYYLDETQFEEISLSEQLHTREIRMALVKRWLEIKYTENTNEALFCLIKEQKFSRMFISCLFHLMELGDSNADRFHLFVNTIIINSSKLLKWLPNNFKNSSEKIRRREFIRFKYLHKRYTNTDTRITKQEINRIGIEVTDNELNILNETRDIYDYQDKVELVKNNLELFKKITGNMNHFEILLDSDYFFIVFELLIDIKKNNKKFEELYSDYPDLFKQDEEQLYVPISNQSNGSENELYTVPHPAKSNTPEPEVAPETPPPTPEVAAAVAPEPEAVAPAPEVAPETPPPAPETPTPEVAAAVAPEVAPEVEPPHYTSFENKSGVSPGVSPGGSPGVSPGGSPNIYDSVLPLPESKIVKKGDSQYGINMIETQVCSGCGIHSIKNLLQREIDTKKLARAVSSSRESLKKHLLKNLRVCETQDRILAEDALRYLPSCPTEMLNNDEVILLLSMVKSKNRKDLETEQIPGITNLEKIRSKSKSFIGFIHNVSSTGHFVAWIFKNGNWYEVNSRIETNRNITENGTITEYTIPQFNEKFKGNKDLLIVVSEKNTTGGSRVRSKKRHFHKSNLKSKRINYN